MTSEEEFIELEKQVVIRSRAKPRSVSHSAVPSDVLGSGEFVKQGGTAFLDLPRSKVIGAWDCPLDRKAEAL